MENLIPFTLFGSGVAFGIMLVIMFILLIISDVNGNGFLALFIVLCVLGINYFWGNFPVLSYITFRNIGIYLLLGFIFSLIRTYFKGKELKPEDKKYFKLKDHVFRWWFLFPFSLISWVFGRLLRDLYNVVYSKISRVYTSIFNI